MSLLPELEKRLAENEERIAALIQHLDDHVELEESLRAAGSGLKEANFEVKRLAESAKVASKSLAAVIASFQEAVVLLQRSDPARATEAVMRVEERLNDAERGIREAIGGAAGVISSGQEKAEHQVRTEAQAIRKSIPTAAAYITLTLVVILLALEIFRHFPTLLSG